MSQMINDDIDKPKLKFRPYRSSMGWFDGLLGIDMFWYEKILILIVYLQRLALITMYNISWPYFFLDYSRYVFMFLLDFSAHHGTVSALGDGSFFDGCEVGCKTLWTVFVMSALIVWALAVAIGQFSMFYTVNIERILWGFLQIAFLPFANVLVRYFMLNKAGELDGGTAVWTTPLSEAGVIFLVIFLCTFFGVAYARCSRLILFNSRLRHESYIRARELEYLLQFAPTYRNERVWMISHYRLNTWWWSLFRPGLDLVFLILLAAASPEVGIAIVTALLGLVVAFLIIVDVHRCWSSDWLEIIANLALFVYSMLGVLRVFNVRNALLVDSELAKVVLGIHLGSIGLCIIMCIWFFVRGHTFKWQKTVADLRAESKYRRFFSPEAIQAQEESRLLETFKHEAAKKERGGRRGGGGGGDNISPSSSMRTKSKNSGSSRNKTVGGSTTSSLDRDSTDSSSDDDVDDSRLEDMMEEEDYMREMRIIDAVRLREQIRKKERRLLGKDPDAADSDKDDEKESNSKKGLSSSGLSQSGATAAAAGGGGGGGIAGEQSPAREGSGKISSFRAFDGEIVDENKLENPNSDIDSNAPPERADTPNQAEIEAELEAKRAAAAAAAAVRSEQSDKLRYAQALEDRWIGIDSSSPHTWPTNMSIVDELMRRNASDHLVDYLRAARKLLDRISLLHNSPMLVPTDEIKTHIARLEKSIAHCKGERITHHANVLHPLQPIFEELIEHLTYELRHFEAKSVTKNQNSRKMIDVARFLRIKMDQREKALSMISPQMRRILVKMFTLRIFNQLVFDHADFLLPKRFLAQKRKAQSEAAFRNRRRSGASDFFEDDQTEDFQPSSRRRSTLGGNPFSSNSAVGPDSFVPRSYEGDGGSEGGIQDDDDDDDAERNASLASMLRSRKNNTNRRSSSSAGEGGGSIPNATAAATAAAGGFGGDEYYGAEGEDKKNR